MKVTIEVADSIAQEFNELAKKKGFANGIAWLRQMVKNELRSARRTKSEDLLFADLESALESDFSL